jgi:peptide/nickel transport system substrate-binding protein
MKNFTRLVVVSLLIAVLVVPLMAQDAPGPGEGGPVIWPNLGDDISSINPILTSDGSSNTVIGRMFPGLVGVDPDTVWFAEDQPGALAKSWEISEDGLVYTFHLKDTYTWSDGTPVTANDVVYAFDAINTIDTPLSYVLEDVAGAVAVDDYTLEITVHAPSCAAMLNIGAIPTVPSHQYAEWFPTFEDMIESDLNQPTNTDVVSADRFIYSSFRAGEQVTMLANPDYPDGYLGYVVPEGYIFKNVADQTLTVESFLNGDLTILASTPDDRKDEIRALAAEGALQLSEAPAGSVRFIAFNEADPTNPQPAVDEEGNALDQGNHPVLGDVRVRQALMHATDWESMNLAVFNGEGIQLSSHWLPTNWAYDADAVPFYDFDLEKSDALLTEAGWTDADGDGTRECNGCMYAEEGAPFEARLITNAGNTGNENMGLILVDQWHAIGLDLDFEPIEFGTLVDELLSQEYDMVMIFWGFGSPTDPGQDIYVTHHPDNDLPGAGFNTSSYNNERVNEILEIANDPSLTNNCDVETRKELYLEAYTLMRDDVPWFWVSTSIVVTAAQPYVENWDPRIGSGTSLWNIDAWVVQEQ